MNNYRTWLKILLAAALIAAAVMLARHFELQALLRAALDRLAALGPAGAAAFVLLYIAAAALLVPGSALTLGAGAIYGVVWGSLIVSLASTLGAAAAFLIGRHLARGWVEKKVAGSPAFAAIAAAVAEGGWRIVGLTRLSPVFPYTLLNYAYGLTKVPFKEYLLASWIGMMPGTVMYVYLGALAGELARSGSGGGRSPAEWALYAGGLAATVIVTVYVTRLARRKLKAMTGPGAKK
ncbi:MAG: SNARE associated Golgi family protein [Elusimicrobia bacterium]|nr:MAG: SNARE associated Golgi family protein [Elusimicrobiota bacterium]KAF0154009.1 MAG: SNARE associated Golgi family protein [Elusimicrobiota bacterium]